MHEMNAAFWHHVNRKYHAYFERKNLRVLEVGSLNVNGSVRDLLDIEGVREYVGVDWREGSNVDHVCLAHEMNFSRKFDVVISCSMLEHDPYWKMSIPNMVAHLKPDGILCLSWGAVRNESHCEDTAPDGLFHALPAGMVLDLLWGMGMYVHEFIYEGNHYREETGFPEGSGMGEVCLVAFKKKKYAIGERRVDELLEEDE